MIFAFSATTLELFDIVEGTDNRLKSVRTDPTNILPVAGGSVGLERKVDTALRQSFQNRDEIGVIKASGAVRSRPQPSGNRQGNRQGSVGTDKPSENGKTSDRICKNSSCKNDLDKLGKRRDAKYCSPKCRKNHHENKNKS